MTSKQKEIYDFIISYMKENLFSPTVREIGMGVGLNPHHQCIRILKICRNIIL